MKITMYGIKNCDTIRKARAWLKTQSIDYAFHDYKSAGITQSKLKAWCKQVDWEQLINRRGTTWRKLTEVQKADLDQNKAIRVMQEFPSIIKRPVIEIDDKILVGFSESEYQEAFQSS